MKKLALFLIFALLVTTFLTAAGPPLRLVRLVVINKSGNVVYIKLDGTGSVGGQFYYLTVDKGSKTTPFVAAFTVVSDVYQRTTIYGAGDIAACEGVTSTGRLIMDSHVRLTFTECDVIPWRRADAWVKTEKPEQPTCHCPWFDPKCACDWWKWNQEWKAFKAECKFVKVKCGDDYWLCPGVVREINRGEPRMEKVTYFKYVRFYGYLINYKLGGKYPDDNSTDYWNQKIGCGWWSNWVSTFRNPYRTTGGGYYSGSYKALCWWRYRY